MVGAAMCAIHHTHFRQRTGMANGVAMQCTYLARPLTPEYNRTPPTLHRNTMSIKTAAGFIFALMAMASALAAPRESDIALDSGGTIRGTLTLAEGAARSPVVLLIAGSGPTDRNGNGPGMTNNSLQDLAHALAAAGIASVRYDKRGIGGSALAGAREADLRFDRYVDDASAWVALLRKDARFTKTVIVGHSEGALVGLLATNAGRADGFVSLAGAGERAPVILRRQLAGKLPPGLAKESDRILTALEQGQLASEVPPELVSLYRPSVQPYLISWFKYDPAAEFAKLRVAAAVMQGGTDLQVSVDDARKLHQARPGSTLVIVPGMNHVLKTAEGDVQAQMKSYTTADFPVSAELVVALVKFIQTP